MKEKINKKLAFVLAGALCVAIAVPAITAFTGSGSNNLGVGFEGVYGGQSFTAFAEDAAEEPTATYTMQTKGMHSLNNDYLLLTTNIDDVSKYGKVGYEISVNGEEATDSGSEKYYDSITFKTDAEGGTRTDMMADIFEGNVVTGMIVTEIPYSNANSYSITPYLVTNEGTTEKGTTIQLSVAPSYEWDFDKDPMAEANGSFAATKIGDGNATFADGKYVHAADGSIVYWQLSEPLVLSKDKDWSMEWKGYSGSPMNGHASVLFSNGANIFITFQESNGIYVSNGSAKAKFNSTYITLDDIYAEHVWKLSYSAAEGKIELLQDGVSKGKLAWSSTIELTHMFGATATSNGASDNNYSFVGNIDYIKVDADQTYTWNFDTPIDERNGSFTAGKIGDGNATFADGKYTHAADGSIVYWQLSESLVLPNDKDWSMEWKGYSGSPMNGNASVLFSNGANIFITFQNTRGIYISNGSAKAQFNSTYITLDDMYSEHVWKLSYSAAEGKIELLQDGVSKGKLAWSSTIELTHMFGATETYSSSDKNYSFVGSIDYIKVFIAQ